MLKSHVLPTVVFGMKEPFTESQVCTAIEERVIADELNELDLTLTVDLYLGNLVQHGILIRNGSEYAFRSSGRVRQQDIHL